MINVLIVEDSRVIRDYLVHVLQTDPEIRVIGTAADGEQALEHVSRQPPDVILMDIHLPGIDGFETTRRIMSSNPIPIVVCTSSLNFNEVDTAMRALEAGALAALKKPRGFGDAAAEADIAAIKNTLKLMSEIKVIRRWNLTAPAASRVSRTVAGSMTFNHTDQAVSMVAIGASTGGPPVIARILSGLTPDFALPVLIVQHISPGFIDGFAEWLRTISRLTVHVAHGGEMPLPGHVYIAPDGFHMRINIHGELMTTRDEPLNGLRPSVGVLFRSVAESFKSKAVGVLLSGMGRDGAEELKIMAELGAITIAQDEASCVVFGMPAEAIRLGAAKHVFPPDTISEILVLLSRSNAMKRGLNE